MEAFHRYVKDNDKEVLLDTLKDVEAYLIEEYELDKSNGEGIWFRFFEGDTLATTIRNIEASLENQNRNYMLTMFEFAYRDASLQVYFS